MKFETKFEVGQKVWAIVKSRVIEMPIHSAKIEIEKDVFFIKYFCNKGIKEIYDFELIDEKYLFNSKQELIESL